MINRAFWFVLGGEGGLQNTTITKHTKYDGIFTFRPAISPQLSGDRIYIAGLFKHKRSKHNQPPKSPVAWKIIRFRGSISFMPNSARIVQINGQQRPLDLMATTLYTPIIKREEVGEGGIYSI